MGSSKNAKATVAITEKQLELIYALNNKRACKVMRNICIM